MSSIGVIVLLAGLVLAAAAIAGMKWPRLVASSGDQGSAQKNRQIFAGASAVFVAAGIGMIAMAAPRVDRDAMPEDQQRVIVRLEEFSDRIRSTENGAVKAQIAAEQRAYIERLLGSTVSGWVGKLATVDTTFDGRILISVDLSDHIRVMTHNSALFDADGTTLIAKSSPLYETLVDMKIGQRVRFNAKLLREMSVTDEGRTAAPDLLTVFTSITPL